MDGFLGEAGNIVLNLQLGQAVAVPANDEVQGIIEAFEGLGNGAYLGDGSTSSPPLIVGNVELGGLLNAGGTSNSTEQGTWTVVRSPFGSLLVLQAANGLAIVTFKLPSPGRLIIGDQEFQFHKFLPNP